MPTKQKHRGKHPKDEMLFNSRHLPAFRDACADYRWLLSKGYGETSSIKIVGDRYRLVKRQRFAVKKVVSSHENAKSARKREVDVTQVRGQTVCIDGFNILILAEVLFSKGFIFECDDGCFRDIASIHGSYRRVQETTEAIWFLGKNIQSLMPSKVIWYLDTPVSNSAKLKELLVERALANGWNWQINLVNDPDKALISCDNIVLSSDRQILEKCKSWFNFSNYLVKNFKGNKNHIIWKSD